MDGVFAPLVLGFLLGLRHATDADHVVAVGAIVSRERSLRAASAIGALWGVGHTATLLVVGGAIVLFGLAVPPRAGLGMELAVAVMLVALGTMNLTGTMRRLHDAAHGPGGDARARGLFAIRPLLVGTVHGLAGSAAIALLVLATIRDARGALAYLALFGAGTVAGMVLLTTLMAAPLALTARRSSHLHERLAQVTGALSIAFGLVLAYRVGVIDGLFTATPHWTPQ